MKFETKLHGVDGLLRTLKSLPPELVSKRGGPVKLALAKGARLLRDQVKLNLQAAIAADGDETTGLLLDNVIASRGKPPFGGKGERYLVRVRRKEYPGRKPEKRGGVATVRKSAALLEYGSSRQTARPSIRPAIQQKGAEVIAVVTSDLLQRTDRLVRKLAAQNKGR
ncbi:hypothetical protein [Achromobacter pestifer]